MFSNPRRWASADTSVLRSLFEAHLRPSFVSFHLPTRSPRLGQQCSIMAKATTATVRPTCHFGPATGQLCRRILKRGIHTLSRMRKVRSRISQTKKRDVEMSKTVPCQIGSYWRIGWGTYQENDSSVKGGVGMLIQI